MYYSLSKLVAWQEVPSGEYIYIKNCQNNFLYKITDVSKEIWLLIVKNRSKEFIINMLNQQYNVSKDTLEEDFNTFINSLIYEKLVECKNEEGGKHEKVC